jgi:hypothetical protein
MPSPPPARIPRQACTCTRSQGSVAGSPACPSAGSISPRRTIAGHRHYGLGSRPVLAASLSCHRNRVGDDVGIHDEAPDHDPSHRVGGTRTRLVGNAPAKPSADAGHQVHAEWTLGAECKLGHEFARRHASTLSVRDPSGCRLSANGACGRMRLLGTPAVEPCAHGWMVALRQYVRGPCPAIAPTRWHSPGSRTGPDPTRRSRRLASLRSWLRSFHGSCSDGWLPLR